MTDSLCCGKPVIQWFGKVSLSFDNVKRPYQWLCMGCGEELPEQQIKELEKQRQKRQDSPESGKK